jgi:hypothetical protein
VYDLLARHPGMDFGTVSILQGVRWAPKIH